MNYSTLLPYCLLLLAACSAATEDSPKPDAGAVVLLGDEAALDTDFDKAVSHALGVVEEDMVLVEGGTFIMGCLDRKQLCDPGTLPLRNVFVGSFWISRFEVTQALWKAVMGNEPSAQRRCAECPVEEVNWDDAKAFCSTLADLTGKPYRLPTEAEWEYAARGGPLHGGHRYSGGKDPVHVAVCRVEGRGEPSNPAPVGSLLPNELGLYDMSGNVAEWCADRHAFNYPRKYFVDDPQGPTTGDDRVIRGGSFLSDPDHCAVFSRTGCIVTGRFSFQGFRLAMSDTAKHVRERPRPCSKCGPQVRPPPVPRPLPPDHFRSSEAPAEEREMKQEQ